MDQVNGLVRSGKPADALKLIDRFLANKPKDPQLRFANPGLLRRRHRDLLTDERSSERREGVALPAQPGLAQLRDELAHHPVTLHQVLAGLVPVRRCDGVQRRHGAPQAFTQTVPWGPSLSSMPLASKA